MRAPKIFRHYCILVILLLLVYVADVLTTAEVSVGPLYLLAVGYAAWVIGLTGGLLASFACAFLWMIADMDGGSHYSQSWMIWENSGVRFITYIAETACFTLYRSTLEAHRRRLAMMEQVLAVCPGCGRIGPQEGGWRSAEELHKTNKDRYKLCPTCSSTKTPHAPADSARSELA